MPACGACARRLRKPRPGIFPLFMAARRVARTGTRLAKAPSASMQSAPSDITFEERAVMRSESMILIWTGIVGGMLGLAAVLADVSGVAAVLCGLVFALAALCLFT